MKYDRLLSQAREPQNQRRRRSSCPAFCTASSGLGAAVLSLLQSSVATSTILDTALTPVALLTCDVSIPLKLLLSAMWKPSVPSIKTRILPIPRLTNLTCPSNRTNVRCDLTLLSLRDACSGTSRRGSYCRRLHLNQDEHICLRPTLWSCRHLTALARKISNTTVLRNATLDTLALDLRHSLDPTVFQKYRLHRCIGHSMPGLLVFHRWYKYDVQLHFHPRLSQVSLS